MNNADKPSAQGLRRRQRSSDRTLNANAPAALELRIEEVGLHGFAPNDRVRIGEAMQREVTRLFREQGVPLSLAQGRAIERLDGGTLQLAPGAKPRAFGSQLAQAVYGGLIR